VTAFPGVHSSYLWKNVAITLWFGPATVESLPVYEQGCKRFCEKYPGGVSSVHIMVPGGSSMPTAEARAELSRIIRSFGHHTVGVGVIIPGSGFWASALRSMVTALAMLAPRGFGLQIFGDHETLSEWLAPLHSARTSVPVQPAELRWALDAALRSGTRAAA
jgi:hypothetical protein